MTGSTILKGDEWILDQRVSRKPASFSPWVVHDKALGIPKTDGVVDWKEVRNLLKSDGII